MRELAYDDLDHVSGVPRRSPMDLLLAFSRGPMARHAFCGRIREPVTRHELAPFAGWNGALIVADDGHDVLQMDTSDRGTFLAAGRHAGLADGAARWDQPIEAVAMGMTGHFIIVRQRGGQSAEICTDPMASLPLYLYRGREEIRVSTRLDWLLASVERPWTISWQQVFSFVLASSYAGRRVFVDDVTLLDFASVYAFSPRGEFAARPYWSPPYDGAATFEEQGGKVQDALCEVVARLTAGKETVAISLTGGVDSRLLLATMLAQDSARVRTITHGFAGSSHHDVTIARAVTQAMAIPHVLLDSTDRVLTSLQAAGDDGWLWKSLGGQARHNFVYDLMMYDHMRELGWETELRGLAGGLFKAKWHATHQAPQITPDRTRPYQRYFGGRAAAALDGLDRYFLEESMRAAPAPLAAGEREGWLAYAVRFSNRIAPRTFFQAQVFASVNPFYDRGFLDAYLSIQASKRARAAVHLRLIERLNPRLLAHPYVQKRLPFEWREGRQHPKGWLRHRPVVQRLRDILERRGPRLRARAPVPASWEYLKPDFVAGLSPLLEESRALFPDELGGLRVEHFATEPLFDARFFRLCSTLRFIVHCNALGVPVR